MCDHSLAPQAAHGPSRDPLDPPLSELPAALAKPLPIASSYPEELRLFSGQAFGESPVALQLIPSPFQIMARIGSCIPYCRQRQWGAGPPPSLGRRAQGCWAKMPPSLAQLSLGKLASIFPAGSSYLMLSIRCWWDSWVSTMHRA